MKKIIFSMALCLGLSSAARAQADVHLLINHKLGSSTYSSNTTATNNLGDQFKINRLDYYLAEITLYHDGGQATAVTDHYILVKAGREGSLRLDSLGNFNITQLDSIRFGIGVDGGRNNSDISTYASGHPLSYQSPSMHWGWAAGYRFVAIEGVTGTSMGLGWQIHGLGNQNYGYTTVATSGNWNGSQLTIAIDADYEKALKDIAVSGSLNYHGSSGQAISLLDNFKSEVFSAGSGSVSLSEAEAPKWSVYPNPSSGICQIELGNQDTDMHIEIRDLRGQLVQLIPVQNNQLSIELESAGIYLVNLCQGQEILDTQKLIIQ